MSAPKGFLSAEELAAAVTEGRELSVRACGDCRHSHNMRGGFGRCHAVDFYISVASTSERLCGPQRRYWEARPLRRVGIFERAWRFLFGWRP